MYDKTMDDDNSSANCQSDGNDLVRGAGFIQIFSQSPGNGVSVVCLEGCAAPRRIPIAIEK